VILAFRRLLYILNSIWQEDSNQQQRFRRILLFLAWQVRKRVSSKPIEARLFNGLRMQVWPDCGNSPAALYYVLPNSRPLSFLRANLDGGTFCDIGANVGLVSLLVADKVEHAILFEPSPTPAQRAKNNISINDLKFEVFPLALSDAIGTIEFENLSGASPCNRTIDGFTTSAPTIKVERTTFDNFVIKHNVPTNSIRVVKIDVEGHENSVLRGMVGFLKNQRPKLVMFEYLQRTSIVQTLDIFKQVDYMVFELSEAGPRIATDKVAPLQDLFACPVELASQYGLKPRDE
jgi:FkbM family methyltransferase